MVRRSKTGGMSERLKRIRNGSKRRRISFAQRAEEFAAQVGVLVGRKASKAGRKRPLKTERGGKHATRSAGRATRGIKAVKINIRDGRKVGRGRKRLRPG